MELVQVDQYESDLSEEELMEVDEASEFKRKQQKKKSKFWIKIRLKCCKPPPAAKTVPIGQKRKRGRPAKAKAALLIQ
ncbi:unnamed protein product [Rotaria sp. Silwood2]|nr:unnamed protein product [Rotaria sp. Silwood2]CAF4662327.1 unnamed protein product [Rotaria sp. Silwood2]